MRKPSNYSGGAGPGAVGAGGIRPRPPFPECRPARCPAPGRGCRAPPRPRSACLFRRGRHSGRRPGPRCARLRTATPVEPAPPFPDQPAGTPTPRTPTGRGRRGRGTAPAPSRSARTRGTRFLPPEPVRARPARPVCVTGRRGCSSRRPGSAGTRRTDASRRTRPARPASPRRPRPLRVTGRPGRPRFPNSCVSWVCHARDAIPPFGCKMQPRPIVYPVEFNRQPGGARDDRVHTTPAAPSATRPDDPDRQARREVCDRLRKREEERVFEARVQWFLAVSRAA